MKIDMLTLFPNSFTPLTESILGRAQKNDNIDGTLKMFIGDEMGDLVQETTDSAIIYVSIRITYK